MGRIDKLIEKNLREQRESQKLPTRQHRAMQTVGIDKYYYWPDDMAHTRTVLIEDYVVGLEKNDLEILLSVGLVYIQMDKSEELNKFEFEKDE